VRLLLDLFSEPPVLAPDALPHGLAVLLAAAVVLLARVRFEGFLAGEAISHSIQAECKERFAELGAEAVRFLDGIVQTRRCGKDEAFRVLGLLATYRREDLMKALERAYRYRAFSFSAVERILAAQARPRSDWEALQAEAREHLEDILQQPSLSPRPTAEYQELLDETASATPESETEDDGEST